MLEPDEDELSEESSDHPAPVALPFAPAWKRVLAFLIDYLLLQSIMFIVIMLFYKNEFASMSQLLTPDLPQATLAQNYLTAVQGFMRRHWEISIGLYGLYFAYFCIFWKNGGQTLGAKILNIGVVSLNRHGLSYMEAILRSLTLLCGMILYFIPFIFVINPVYKQRLHDSVSGSAVVSYTRQEKKRPQ